MTKARVFVVAVAVTVLGGAGVATAAAQSDYVGRRPVTVERDPANAQPQPQTRVLGRTMTRSAPIPITGGDVAGLALAGAGAIGTGTVLLRRGRRAPR